MEDQEYNALLDGPNIAIPKDWIILDIIHISSNDKSRIY